MATPVGVLTDAERAAQREKLAGQLKAMGIAVKGSDAIPKTMGAPEPMLVNRAAILPDATVKKPNRIQMGGMEDPDAFQPFDIGSNVPAAQQPATMRYPAGGAFSAKPPEAKATPDVKTGEMRYEDPYAVPKLARAPEYYAPEGADYAADIGTKEGRDYTKPVRSPEAMAELSAKASPLSLAGILFGPAEASSDALERDEVIRDAWLAGMDYDRQLLQAQLAEDAPNVRIKMMESPERTGISNRQEIVQTLETAYRDSISRNRGYGTWQKLDDGFARSLGLLTPEDLNPAQELELDALRVEIGAAAHSQAIRKVEVGLAMMKHLTAIETSDGDVSRRVANVPWWIPGARTVLGVAAPKHYIVDTPEARFIEGEEAGDYIPRVVFDLPNAAMTSKIITATENGGDQLLADLTSGDLPAFYEHYMQALAASLGQDEDEVMARIETLRENPAMRDALMEGYGAVAEELTDDPNLITAAKTAGWIAGFLVGDVATGHFDPVSVTLMGTGAATKGAFSTYRGYRDAKALRAVEGATGAAEATEASAYAALRAEAPELADMARFEAETDALVDRSADTAFAVLRHSAETARADTEAAKVAAGLGDLSDADALAAIQERAAKIEAQLAKQKIQHGKDTLLRQKAGKQSVAMAESMDAQHEAGKTFVRAQQQAALATAKADKAAAQLAVESTTAAAREWHTGTSGVRKLLAQWHKEMPELEARLGDIWTDLKTKTSDPEVSRILGELHADMGEYRAANAAYKEAVLAQGKLQTDLAEATKRLAQTVGPADKKVVRAAIAQIKRDIVAAETSAKLAKEGRDVAKSILKDVSPEHKALYDEVFKRSAEAASLEEQIALRKKAFENAVGDVYRGVEGVEGVAKTDLPSWEAIDAATRKHMVESLEESKRLVAEADARVAQVLARREAAKAAASVHPDLRDGAGAARSTKRAQSYADAELARKVAGGERHVEKLAGVGKKVEDATLAHDRANRWRKIYVDSVKSYIRGSKKATRLGMVADSYQRQVINVLTDSVIQADVHGGAIIDPEKLWGAFARELGRTNVPQVIRDATTGVERTVQVPDIAEGVSRLKWLTEQGGFFGQFLRDMRGGGGPVWISNRTIHDIMDSGSAMRSAVIFGSKDSADVGRYLLAEKQALFDTLRSRTGLPARIWRGVKQFVMQFGVDTKNFRMLGPNNEDIVRVANAATNRAAQSQGELAGLSTSSKVESVSQETMRKLPKLGLPVGVVEDVAVETLPAGERFSIGGFIDEEGGVVERGVRNPPSAAGVTPAHPRDTTTVAARPDAPREPDTGAGARTEGGIPLRAPDGAIDMEPDGTPVFPSPVPGTDGGPVSSKADIEMETKFSKRRLLKMMGKQMYSGSMVSVSVKELLQNSVDAVREVFPNGGGWLDIRVDEVERVIEITDNGIGMTPEIIQKAFLTLGGQGKGIGASGGFGMAKAHFMTSSEWIEIDTVRDGVRSTTHATEADLLDEGGKVRVTTTPAPGVASGTRVRLKILSEDVNRSGEVERIYFHPSDAVEVLKKPVLAQVDIRLKTGDEWVQVQNGEKFDYDKYVKLEAEYSWGSADIYVSKARKTTPSYVYNGQTLSNGLIQFGTEIRGLGGDELPYEILINMKPKVTADDPHYPFDVRRQGWNHNVNDDIKATMAYIASHSRGLEAKELADIFKEAVSLERMDTAALEDARRKGEIVIRRWQSPSQRERVLTTEEKVRRLEQDLERMTRKVRVTSGGVIIDVDTGANITEKVSDKAKQSMVGKGAARADDVFGTVSFDTSKPIFHNNVDIDYNRASPQAHEFFTTIANLVQDFREEVAKVIGFEKLQGEYAVGISLDKQYHGIHIRTPYKAFFFNPLSSRAKTPRAAAEGALHTMIHEGAHTQHMTHDADFAGSMAKLYQQLSESDSNYAVIDKLRNKLTVTYENHWSTFEELRDAFQRYDVQPRTKSLEVESKLAAGSKTDTSAVGTRVSRGPSPAGGEPSRSAGATASGAGGIPPRRGGDGGASGPPSGPPTPVPGAPPRWGPLNRQAHEAVARVGNIIEWIDHNNPIPFSQFKTWVNTSGSLVGTQWQRARRRFLHDPRTAKLLDELRVLEANQQELFTRLSELEQGGDPIAPHLLGLSRVWLPGGEATPGHVSYNLLKFTMEELKRNEGAGGDFFDFMLKLRERTRQPGAIAGEVGMDRAGAGNVDTNLARVFGFGAEVVSHGANLAETERQLTKVMGGVISPDDAMDFNALITGSRFKSLPVPKDAPEGTRPVKVALDYKKGVEVANRFGTLLSASGVEVAEAGATMMGNAAKLSFQLVRLNDDPATPVWATKPLVNHLDSQLGAVIKELEGRHYSEGGASGAYKALLAVNSMWKRGVTIGWLYPSPKYQVSNYLGNIGQRAVAEGIIPAAKTATQDFFPNIPLVGKGIQDAMSRMSEKYGGKPVLGPMLHWLVNPHIGAIFNGEKGAIRLKNGLVATYDDVRRWMIEDGIMDTVVHEDLSSVFSRYAPPMWERIMGFASGEGTAYHRWMSDSSVMVQQRSRAAMYLDVLGREGNRGDARKLTLEALYDWKNAVPQVMAMAQHVAFWRFMYLSYDQTIRAVTDPLIRPGPEFERMIAQGSRIGHMRSLRAIGQTIHESAQGNEKGPYKNLAEQREALAKYVGRPYFTDQKWNLGTYANTDDAMTQYYLDSGKMGEFANYYVEAPIVLTRFGLLSATLGAATSEVYAGAFGAEPVPGQWDEVMDTWLGSLMPWERVQSEALLEASGIKDTHYSGTFTEISAQEAALLNSLPTKLTGAGAFQPADEHGKWYTTSTNHFFVAKSGLPFINEVTNLAAVSIYNPYRSESDMKAAMFGVSTMGGFGPTMSHGMTRLQPMQRKIDKYYKGLLADPALHGKFQGTVPVKPKMDDPQEPPVKVDENGKPQ